MSGDHKDFVRLLELAKDGSVAAQLITGDNYRKGIGVEKNLTNAYKWYEEAAQNGNSIAQYLLACLYASGDGVAKDQRKAFEWGKKSAEAGYAEAQFSTAKCYDQELLGTVKNLEKAFTWYRKAAEQGHCRAQTLLGKCYENGEGVCKDVKKAFEWYLKAAKHGDGSAQFYVGVFYERGEIVEKNLKNAFEWYLKSANQGLSPAQFQVAQYYQRGDGVEKNLEKTFYWFLKCAEQGDSVAQYNVAVCLFNGRGVDVDYNESYKWCLKSAEQGNADALKKIESYEKRLQRKAESTIHVETEVFIQNEKINPAQSPMIKSWLTALAAFVAVYICGYLAAIFQVFLAELFHRVDILNPESFWDINIIPLGINGLIGFLSVLSAVSFLPKGQQKIGTILFTFSTLALSLLNTLYSEATFFNHLLVITPSIGAIVAFIKLKNKFENE